MAAIVQDHRSAYGILMESCGTHIPLNDCKPEAVTAIALSRYDPSFVALGTESGTLQVYSIDADGTNCDSWIDARIANNKKIVALEFVPPPNTDDTSFTSSLIALTQDGNLIALDVFQGGDNSQTTNENTRLLSFSKHESENQHGSFRIQASIKLTDFVSGSSELPTGAIAVLDDDATSPLICLGMSGGTLLVLKRKYDLEGYSWDCVKQLSLPSAVLSLALSTHGANSVSEFPMLAAGLEVSELAPSPTV